MSTQPKRPRSSTSSSNPEGSKPVVQNDTPSKPKPHSTLWFEDGNVVLATNVHLYSIHKGILSKQSSVFNEMFRMPQAEEGKAKPAPETWNGLPLVNMIGDKDEDVYNLIMAVYDRKHYTVHETVDYNVFSSLVTMSTKYNFRDIRSELVKHLKPFFPDNLMGYDNRIGLKALFRDFPSNWQSRLLSLVQTLNFPLLLPAVLYACAVQPIKAIFESLKFIPRNYHESIMASRERLMKFSVRFGTISLFPDNRCNSALCTENRAKLLLIHMNFSNFDPPKFPLEMPRVGILVGEHGNRPEVCQVCTKSYCDTLQQHRLNFWNSLPAIFGLPNWEDLRKASTL